MATSKKIIIIAGPNGAGKTTFAMEFLPNEADTLTFINADLIAAGLNPFQPESEAMRAGRLMLSMIDDRLRREESFAFETTLNGRGYARMILKWREQGYWVKLYFLRAPEPGSVYSPCPPTGAGGGPSHPRGRNSSAVS